MNAKQLESRKRRRGEKTERLQRILKHRDKIEMLKAIVATREERGADSDIAEVRRLRTRIRVLEQQVRYIGELYGEAMEQLHHLYLQP